MKIEIKKHIEDAYLPCFAREEFLKFKSSRYGYLIGIEGGELIYLLPFAIKNRLGIKILEFQSNVINYKKIGYSQQSYLDLCIEYLEEYKMCDFICQNPAYALFSEIPAGAKYTYFGSYVVDLTLPEGKLWENIHSKHRNVIRKAKKNGVNIVIDNLILDSVYDVILDTQKRSGNDFISKSEFQHMCQSMRGEIEIFTAYHDVEIQGCAVLLHDDTCCYYLYGGSARNNCLGSLNLLHWEAILHYKKMGLKKYDFVGARLSSNISEKIRGIQRFKKRFGGDLTKGFLWKYVFNKYKYIIYKILYFIRYGKMKVDAIEEEHITDI